MRTGNPLRAGTAATMAAAILWVSGCSADAPQPENGAGQTGSDPERSAADQSTEWVEFTSPEGRFQALFPNEPQVDPGEEPNEVTTQALVGPTAYTVYYFELQDFDRATTTPEMVLDGARQGSVSSVQGQQVSNEKITIAGHPGQSYRVEIPSQRALGEHRILLVDRRLYSLSVIGPKDQFDESQAQKFFDSFALVAQQ